MVNPVGSGWWGVVGEESRFTHHVVDGGHVAHVVGQQRAHLLLAPVSGGVQRRPAVCVPAVDVHLALE